MTNAGGAGGSRGGAGAGSRCVAMSAGSSTRRTGAAASRGRDSSGTKSRGADVPSPRYAWTIGRPPRSRCGSSTTVGWGPAGWPVAVFGSQQPRCSTPVSGRRLASRPQYPWSPARARRKWVQVEQVVDDRRQTQQRAVSACGAPQCGQCHMTNHIVAARASVRHGNLLGSDRRRHGREQFRCRCGR